jgi:hypothetical protein
MTWFRSRRFILGLTIGLAPLFLIALLALVGPDRESADTQRVVVRNYSDCVADSLAAARTAGLIDALPADAILVETFPTCRGQGDRISRMHSGRVCNPAVHQCQAGDQPAGPLAPTDPVAQYDHMHFPDLAPLGPLSAAGGIPYLPAPTEAERNLAWLAILAAPLIGFTGLFRSDRRLPDGIICPDDSGLPTGDQRPRC